MFAGGWPGFVHAASSLSALSPAMPRTIRRSHGLRAMGIVVQHVDRNDAVRSIRLDIEHVAIEIQKSFIARWPPQSPKWVPLLRRIDASQMEFPIQNFQHVGRDDVLVHLFDLASACRGSENSA